MTEPMLFGANMKPELPKVPEVPKPKESVDEEGRIHLTCPAEKCHYSSSYGKGFEDHDKARESFRLNHTAQHAPGKTPDLRNLSVKYSGHCTNCGAYFSYETDDGDDRIWCDECPASWSSYGWDGRTDLEAPE